MQTLAMLVVERKASRHRLPPLLVADQHAGAIDPDTNRRHFARQLRRRVAPAFLLGLDHSPHMGRQILQTGLQATPTMVLLKIVHHLYRSSVRKFVRHDLGKPRRRFSDDPCPIIHRAEGFAAFGALINMPLDRNNPIGCVINL
jgi:hypothetical protein